LAIKSNVDGADDLVYRPEDSKEDWLLAKMTFNQNAFWHGQWYRLAEFHAGSEIVYLVAIRSLSERHPITAILDSHKSGPSSYEGRKFSIPASMAMDIQLTFEIM